MVCRGIETADVAHAPGQDMPAIKGALQLKELNITENTAARLGQALPGLLAKAA